MKKGGESLSMTVGMCVHASSACAAPCELARQLPEPDMHAANSMNSTTSQFTGVYSVLQVVGLPPSAVDLESC
jgi:hypothetical protein